MSAVVSLAERDAFVARAHARAVRRVAVCVGQGMLVIGAIFWGIFLVVTVAVPLIVHQAGGVMGGGAMTGAAYAAPWFAFSLGLITVAAVVVPHLAAGGTRRSLFVGATLAALAAGVAYGAAYALLLLVERATFGALGWEWELLGSGPDTGAAWFLAAGVGEAIAISVYALVGMAVQASYRTCGVWRGTALLVPALALVVLVDTVTGRGSFGEVFDGLTGAWPGTPLGLLLELVVLALAVGWAWWQLRLLRLRPTR